MARVVFGFPSLDMAEAAERGELALGGCIEPVTSPGKWRWTCSQDHGPFIIQDGHLVPDPDTTLTLDMGAVSDPPKDAGTAFRSNQPTERGN